MYIFYFEERKKTKQSENKNRTEQDMAKIKRQKKNKIDLLNKCKWTKMKHKIFWCTGDLNQANGTLKIEN